MSALAHCGLKPDVSRGPRSANSRHMCCSKYSITSLARANNVGRIFIPELFIASATYWIKFAHTAQYKTAAQAIAINTNQIAILPNLGTSR